MLKEERFLDKNTIEIRAVEGQDSMTISGYAAVFNTPYDNGYWIESIAPGAFRNSLADDVAIIWNHNDDHVLGRTSSGTLKIYEDQKGLGFENELPQTQMGKDAHLLIKRGDVKGVSFGFRVVKQSFEEIGDKVKRVLEEVKLIEISPCVFPAYKEPSVEARSVEDVNKALQEIGYIPNAKNVECFDLRKKKIDLYLLD